jgi:hypothetical protein
MKQTKVNYFLTHRVLIILFCYKEINKKNYTIYGLWISIKSENFDEYLRAIGNNLFL